MSDFGLVLPEHDLTAAEFKDLARRIGRAAFVPLFLKFYERVITNEATVEEQRKALADISRWTGVEEEKKLDPNANLPVFNIVFGAPTERGVRSMEVLEVPTSVPAASDVPQLPADMVALLPKMEALHGQAASDPAPASAHEGEVGADAPRKRRNQRHARERSQAVRPAVRVAAGLPASEDGEPKLSETRPPEMTLEQHLADLDRVLGL